LAILFLRKSVFCKNQDNDVGRNDASNKGSVLDAVAEGFGMSFRAVSGIYYAKLRERTV
jgi:hypothetical protein